MREEKNKQKGLEFVPVGEPASGGERSSSLFIRGQRCSPLTIHTCFCRLWEDGWIKALGARCYLAPFGGPLDGITLCHWPGHRIMFSTACAICSVPISPSQCVALVSIYTMSFP